MNEKEIKKIKSNPVYFVEKYFGMKLTLWQKMHLKSLSKIKFLYRFRRY